MNHSSEDTQHDVFKERLAHLRREDYLSEETYRTVMDASVKYLHDRRVERENKEDVRVDPLYRCRRSRLLLLKNRNL